MTTFKRLKAFVDANGEKRYNQLIDEHLIFIDPAELTAIELYKLFTKIKNTS